MREYDQIADWYAATRSDAVGRGEVDALLRHLRPGARVLDLGCGTGLPLGRQLAEAGVELVGVDSSSEMIERFRANLPRDTAHHARIQDARFPRASFDAIVSWGVLFHLSGADQRAVIPRVAAWLRPGGLFLFTAAEEAGERAGDMEGVSFTYRSLGLPAYRQLVEGAGLALIDVHTDAWDNAVYLARRPPPD